MKKILITGASGYIGSRLSYYLSNKGFKIIALVRKKKSLPKYWSNKMYKIIYGDINNGNTVECLIKQNPQIIIHLISLNQSQSGENINIAFDINVKSTWRLLENFPKLDKFIYFSTIHVHSLSKNSKIGSMSEGQRIYGLTHLLSEKICNIYNKNSNIQCLNIRLSNSYGEPKIDNVECWNLVLNDLVKSAFKKKKIIIKSDGLVARDFIHFSDICINIYKLIEMKEDATMNTFNFTSGRSKLILEIALEVKRSFERIFDENIHIYINNSQRANSTMFHELKKFHQKNVSNYNSDILSSKLMEDGIDDLFFYLKKIKNRP